MQLDPNKGQKDEKTKKIGTLYLCATPIGNLEDITLRVLRILQEVDLIAAEDTRNSIRLLNHFHIKTPMTSYHEYNRLKKAPVLVQQLKEGKKIALITDAGTPGISDPGEDLVRICQKEGIPVTALPGPSAVVTAVCQSGLPVRRFAFEAFLPRDRQPRREILQDLAEETRTIVIYEAPHHLADTLQDLFAVLGDRRICVCREMTKQYEETLQMTLADFMAYTTEHEPRGEYVLVIEGKEEKEIRKEEQQGWQQLPLSDHLKLYTKQGLDKKEAMRAVAKDRGISRREVYQELLQDEEGREQTK